MAYHKHDREPIPNTCPSIDDMISKLEDLRSSNDELRQWGRDEASKVDQLEQEKEDLQEQVTDLSAQLKEAEKERDELANQVDAYEQAAMERSEHD